MLAAPIVLTIASRTRRASPPSLVPADRVRLGADHGGRNAAVTQSRSA